jgi:hypothetical protein
MSDDDEIWDDESESAETCEQYDATLIDIIDQNVNYGCETIEASNDAEAISKAREWAERSARRSVRRGSAIAPNRDQQREALARREAGEALTARTFGVSHTTIGRLR